MTVEAVEIAMDIFFQTRIPSRKRWTVHEAVNHGLGSCECLWSLDAAEFYWSLNHGACAIVACLTNKAIWVVNGKLKWVFRSMSWCFQAREATCKYLLSMNGVQPVKNQNKLCSAPREPENLFPLNQQSGRTIHPGTARFLHTMHFHIPRRHTWSPSKMLLKFPWDFQNVRPGRENVRIVCIIYDTGSIARRDFSKTSCRAGCAVLNISPPW